MTAQQDVDACFKKSFARNENGVQPDPTKKISDYYIGPQQMLLILGMTRDCANKKGWDFPLPTTIDTTQTIGALLSSIYPTIKPIKRMAKPRVIRRRKTAKPKARNRKVRRKVQGKRRKSR